MPPTTQTPTTQKGLFDEADSSATTPPQKEPTQKGKTDFNMEVLESWSKSNEYLRDILDFIKANPLAQEIDSQLTKKWGYDSDVPPLVVFDSALLLKDKEAFLQTKDPLTPKQMQRFREKAERHFAVAQKYGLDLDGFYDFAREWRKVVNSYHNYGHTNKKKIQPSLDSSTTAKEMPTPQETPKVDSSASSFTYTTGEAKGIAELRKDLKQALEPYKSTPITNKETGLQGVITTDEINKIASKKAVDKSVANGFTRDEHFTAAQDLKNLFENSKLKESHADNKHRENIAQVHRFIKDLHINDKHAQAKITLFEKIEGKNRIYTLELESLNKPDSLSVSVPNTESEAKAQSVATAHPETTTIAKTDGGEYSTRF